MCTGKIGERENQLMQIQRRQCPRKVIITKISLKYQILIMIIQDLIVSKVVWEIETLRKKDSLTTKDKTLDFALTTVSFILRKGGFWRNYNL
jgi:hypothetical protein